jgi:hypothetical protein
MPRARSPKSPYDRHPSLDYQEKIIANLPARTGRSLDQWVELVNVSGPFAETDRRAWLKERHGLGDTTASMIAQHACGTGEVYDPEALVEAMFAGPKAALRPIYDRLLVLGKGLGPDVKACPCKTIVPLYRRHVFAEIKPTTRTRIDMGYALGRREASGRMVLTGGIEKKDRITHRIPITSLDEIDDEVASWLRTAYELDR